MNRFVVVLTSLMLLLAVVNAAVQAQVSSQVTITTTAPAVEYWRLGFTTRNAPAKTGMVGRGASTVAMFKSNGGTANTYFVFPARSESRTIQAARFYLLNRAGSYSGNAGLTLEVYDYAGTLKRSLSAGSVDMETVATGTWAEIVLSASASDLAIAAGESVAFRFSLSGGAGGNFEAYPIFEVVAGPPAAIAELPTPTPTPIQVFMPIIFRGSQ